MTELPGPGAGAGEHEQLEQLRRQRRRFARVVAAVVGIVVVIVFVVQNSQPVAVRFWFATGHPRLIWVVLACLAVGTGMGAALGRPRRRAKRQRHDQGRQTR